MPFSEGQEAFVAGYVFSAYVPAGEEDPVSVQVVVTKGSSPHTEAAMDDLFQSLVNHISAYPGISAITSTKTNSMVYTVTPTEE